MMQDVSFYFMYIRTSLDITAFAELPLQGNTSDKCSKIARWTKVNLTLPEGVEFFWVNCIIKKKLISHVFWEGLSDNRDDLFLVIFWICILFQQLHSLTFSFSSLYFCDASLACSVTLELLFGLLGMQTLFFSKGKTVCSRIHLD